jgi:hypothetical protein
VNKKSQIWHPSKPASSYLRSGERSDFPAFPAFPPKQARKKQVISKMDRLILLM